jgi:hypothetical protein
MATAAARTVDHGLVAEHLARLSDAQLSRERFEAAVHAIEADARVKGPDLIAIAKGYAGVAKRITSKPAAFEAIEKRFVELVRDNGKLVQASRARPW